MLTQDQTDAFLADKTSVENAIKGMIKDFILRNAGLGVLTFNNKDTIIAGGEVFDFKIEAELVEYKELQEVESELFKLTYGIDEETVSDEDKARIKELEASKKDLRKKIGFKY